jgi:hypothetical protein
MPPFKKRIHSHKKRIKNQPKIGTSLRLLPEIKTRLQKHAVKDDRTFTSLVSRILSDWIKEQERDEWRDK